MIVTILTTRQEQNFFDKVLIPPDPNECHEWVGGISNKGYGKVQLNGRSEGAHRIAWVLKHGCWPKEFILHHCDNRTCVNTNHLYEGNNSQNEIDKSWRGKRHSTLKLTPANVIEIREMLIFGFLTQKEIGRRFNVENTAISKIKTGHLWSHV